MTTYIVLLRGINVSGQKKIIMSHLREMIQALGFSEVRTYIQSGNVILSSSGTSGHEVAQLIRGGIKKTYGFEVPVLVKSFFELEAIVNQTPFKLLKALETKKWYYVLLQEPPKAELIHNLQQNQFPDEQFVISENCVYLNCNQGYGNTKLNNNFFEKRLEVAATTRNHRTLTKLLEIAGTNEKDKT